MCLYCFLQHINVLCPSLFQEEKEDDLEDGQDGGIINAKNETNSEENIYKTALTNQTEV